MHPSPGGFNSSRLALQSDPSGERSAWRSSPPAAAPASHEVPFAGGVNVAEGKEAMLKPITVSDGVTARLDAVSTATRSSPRRAHNPAGADPSRTTGSDDRVRLASVWTRPDDASSPPSRATPRFRHRPCANFVPRTRRRGGRRARLGRGFDPDSPGASGVWPLSSRLIMIVLCAMPAALSAPTVVAPARSPCGSGRSRRRRPRLACRSSRRGGEPALAVKTRVRRIDDDFARLHDEAFAHRPPHLRLLPDDAAAHRRRRVDRLDAPR